MPNVGDAIFALVLVFLLWFRPNFVFQDGSTGRHLATGDYVLANGMPHIDLFSYTFADKAWVAYEWLFDAAIACIVQLNNGSLNLLAVCTSCAIAALVAMLYGRCRKEGANLPFALAIVLLCCTISAGDWLCRPQIFTFFGVYFFTTLLEDFWCGAITGKKLLLLSTLVMVVWVNLHLEFIIGILLICIYLSSAVIAAACYVGTEKFGDYLNKAKVLLAALVCSLSSTWATPYGCELQEYMLNYMHNCMQAGASIGATTHEFMSPVFHGAFQTICLETIYALLIVGLAISKNKLSLPRLLTCIAFSHLSLSAVRSMPLYAIVILPAIAQLFASVSFGEIKVKSEDEFEEEEEQKPWFSSLNEGWTKLSKGFDTNEALCSKHLISVATVVVLIAIAMNDGVWFDKKVLNSTWSAEDKPIETIVYLKEMLKSGKLDPERGFNYDNWGGYLRYVLGKRVFIDDRSDFYGEKFYYKYTVVAHNLPGWETELSGHIYEGTKKKGYSVQWLLLPRNSAVSTSLKASSVWILAKQDKASELFVRKQDTPAEITDKIEGIVP